MKILITGGAGFLGQYLVNVLYTLFNEANITVIDLKKNPYPHIDLGKLKINLFYNLDITDKKSIEKYFVDVNYCFHLAGVVSFFAGDKKRLFKINVAGTRNVIDLCLKYNVDKLVHVSSVATLGFADKENFFVDEKFRFDFSKTPDKYYMLSKKAADELVLKATEEHNLNACIVCPALMWGAGDFYNTASIIRNIKNGKLKFNAPGGTYIADVYDISLGIIAAFKYGRQGEKYILGGFNYTFTKINGIIAKQLGLPLIKRTISWKWGKIIYKIIRLWEKFLPSHKIPITSDNIDSAFKYRYFDNAKANRYLGWQISKSFAKTIKEQIEYLKMYNLL